MAARSICPIDFAGVQSLNAPTMSAFPKTPSVFLVPMTPTHAVGRNGYGHRFGRNSSCRRRPPSGAPEARNSQ
jgi:hypothetical protein